MVYLQQYRRGTILKPDLLQTSGGAKWLDDGVPLFCTCLWYIRFNFDG